MPAIRNVREGGELPWIVVGEVDRERLSALATVTMDTMPEVASLLLSEMGRAEVAGDEKLTQNVVAMGSVVECIDEGDKLRRVQLVYPGEADTAQGKISVMTPIGVALIGLSTGQSMTWLGSDGRKRRVTVLMVEPTFHLDPVGA